MLLASPCKIFIQFIMKKKQINFKPFDSLKWHEVKEEDVEEVLSKDQFKDFKKNKIYSIGTGTFKMG